MTEQEYDTEMLKRELGRLGYAIADTGADPNRWAWGVGNPREVGAEDYADTERDAWLAALEHARRDKSLTGAKIAAFGPRTGLSGMELTYDQTDKEWTANHGRSFFGIGHTPDEAINALWEAVCLRGAT